MPEKIDSFTDDHRFLSNFEGKVEWIFQAMKTTDWKEQVRVLSASTPGEAKKRGRKVTLRPDWDEIRLDVMEAAVREKFSQPLMARLLEETGDAELVEGNYWHDQFWGDCTCNHHYRSPGQNHLGKLLMKIREENRA
jgi:ribA/ribD-fused uncharacterized protein